MARPWFHTIDLGHGVVTSGYENTPLKLPHMGLPDDLSGKTVLDIGAFDGFFSFEAERRGAERVLATDYYAWERYKSGMLSKEGFDLAHHALKSKVESKAIAVEDISPETVGTFDLVLFLGVLYHSTDPFGYLQRVRCVCRGMAIIETHIDAIDYPRPAMVFISEGHTERRP
jgi:tRNA (mo5U34)-methyltransferase